MSDGGNLNSNNGDVPATGTTLPELMTRMRTGQLTYGPLRPYKWLDYTVKERTQQELNVQKVFDSCSFKSVMSLVVGKMYSPYTTLILSMNV